MPKGIGYGAMTRAAGEKGRVSDKTMKGRRNIAGDLGRLTARDIKRKAKNIRAGGERGRLTDEDIKRNRPY